MSAEQVTGLALILLSIVLRLYSLATLHRHGIDTLSKLAGSQMPDSWATTGPYSHLRHPVYLGILGTIAGVGLIAFGWPGAVLALPALPHLQQRMAQENALREASRVRGEKLRRIG